MSPLHQNLLVRHALQQADVAFPQCSCHKMVAVLCIQEQHQPYGCNCHKKHKDENLRKMI